MNKILILTVVVTAMCHSSLQFSRGGPVTQCESLMPMHRGAEAQTTSSPFKIILKEKSVGNGMRLLVEIRATEEGRTFNGYMLQARAASGAILGQFQAVEGRDSNFVECSGFETTVTNSNNDRDSSVVFEWAAPLKFTGAVRFHATIVESLLIFWVNEVSDEVEVLFVEPPPDTTSSSTSTTVAPPIEDIDIYEGCGVTKTCFGIGLGECVQNQRCNTIGAVIYREEKFIFEMRSSSGVNYVALALSYDDKMGSDSVIECVREGMAIKAYSSFTSTDDSPRTENQSIIRMVRSRFENGVIYCQVERDAVTTVGGLKFDLINDKHFLLLASGTEIASNAVGYHDVDADASGTSFLLTEFNIATGRSRVMLYLHASLMIAAWIGFTSIGIFAARFMKKTWVNTKIFGKDFWFMTHQLSMCTTWLLTLAGFVIILVDSNRWTTNPHSVLGTITFCLCFVQPIGAVFRPGPKDMTRPVFNFLHLSAGNFAHLLAVFTMFYSVNLVRSELPASFTFTLIAFVVLYVTFYITMTIMGFFSTPRKCDKDDDGKNSSHDDTLSTARKILFSFFTLFVALFVIALILLTVLKISD